MYIHQSPLATGQAVADAGRHLYVATFITRHYVTKPKLASWPIARLLANLLIRPLVKVRVSYDFIKTLRYYAGASLGFRFSTRYHALSRVHHRAYDRIYLC